MFFWCQKGWTVNVSPKLRMAFASYGYVLGAKQLVWISKANCNDKLPSAMDYTRINAFEAKVFVLKSSREKSREPSIGFFQYKTGLCQWIRIP